MLTKKKIRDLRTKSILTEAQLKVSTIIDVFFDQERVNVCEHRIKTSPRLYRVFTYSYSVLIEKDICDR